MGSIKKYELPYEVVEHDEYCKRLINLNYALKFYKSKFVKSRKKNKRFKPLRHAKRVLKTNEYKSFKLFYYYFKIDKRLHILNVNKEFLKYDCDNLFFIGNYMNTNIKRFYKDFNKAKYTVQKTDLFGQIGLLMVKKYK